MESTFNRKTVYGRSNGGVELAWIGRRAEQSSRTKAIEAVMEIWRGLRQKEWETKSANTPSHMHAHTCTPTGQKQ